MRELAPNAAATATPASPMYPMAVIHLAWDSLRARASEYGMRVKATMVYLKRPKPGSSLTIKARPLILRVKEVRAAGVVVLQDKAGRTVVHQVS